MIRTASFPQRRDSIRPGSVLGSFEGQVVDADTGQPIAGAIAWCSWSFSRGVGNRAPEAVQTAESKTDVDGRFWIPPLRRLPLGLSTRLDRFSLVVYKKGYVSYRHDRAFTTGRRHRGFSQWGSVIGLSRWSPELSHARHLLFVGGGPSLQQASEGEILAAVQELDGRLGRSGLAASRSDGLGQPAGDRFSLDASRLLSSDEVRSITGFTGAFTEGRLAGQRSEVYDTRHLRAEDLPERYDVAVRIWRMGDEALLRQYEELLSSLPGSKQTDEVGDRSFVVTQGEILGLGFLDRLYSAVVLLTCGRGQCSTDSHLKELAERVRKNLSKLPPLGSGESILSPGGDEGRTRPKSRARETTP